MPHQRIVLVTSNIRRARELSAQSHLLRVRISQLTHTKTNLNNSEICAAKSYQNFIT